MNNWKVWREEKNYRLLFWSGLVNGIGNRFTQVAVLALLYQMTESAIAIGTLFAIRMVPYFIISPFGGRLADRIPKKQLLKWIDWMRMPLALIPIFVQDPEHVWLIYVSAFLIAAGEAVYTPTRMASLPILVKQDRLLYINAIEQILLGVVLIIGSSTGGVVAYYFGLPAAFLADAFTFGLSGFLLNRMRLPEQTAQNEKRKTGSKRKGQSLTKLIFASAALITFLFIELTMPLANGIDNVLMSVYALDVFQMGDLGVGFIYACLGIGFVLSSFLSKFLKNKFIVLIVICIALEGVGHVLLAVAPTFLIVLVTVIWITFVGGISNICLTTLVMKMVPKSRQGAFFGLTAMIANVALGISMGAAGFLIDLFEPRKLSFIVGMTYIGLTCLYAFLLYRLDMKREKRAIQKNLKAERPGSDY